VICQFVSPKNKDSLIDFSVHLTITRGGSLLLSHTSFATIAIEEETTNSAATSIACVVGVDDI